MTGLLILTAPVAAVVAYLQVSVPLAGPSLGHADLTYYWPVAVIAGLVVVILTAVVAGVSLRARKGGE